MIDSVVMEVGQPSATIGRNAICQHRDDTVKRGTIQFAIGTGATDQRKQLLFCPGLRRCSGDDLLGQNVERCRRDLEAIQRPMLDRADQRGAFEQFVSGRGKQPAFRYGLDNGLRKQMRSRSCAPPHSR